MNLYQDKKRRLAGLSVRFKDHLNQKHDFLEIIDKYSDYEFGTFKVKKIELVYNDWYQRKKFLKKIHQFEIITSPTNNLYKNG